MLDIQAWKQTDESRCGPACIKMVLAYYGIEATEDEICERCNHTYELGCTDEQMKAAIESYGLTCYLQNESNLLDVKAWVRKGIPVIVDYFTGGINPSIEDMPEGHSSIVVDLDDDKIHLLDPELGGIRSIERGDFIRCWFDWKNDPMIKKWENMIIRQAMVIYQ